MSKWFRILVVLVVGAAIVEFIKASFGIQITSEQLSKTAAHVICMILYMVWGAILAEASNRREGWF